MFEINKDTLLFTRNMVQSIKPITDPLKKYFGITNFGYLQIFYKNYEYFYLCDNEALLEDYIQNVKDTVIFSREVLPHFKMHKRFQPILWPEHPTHYSMDLYIKYGYWNGLTFSKTNHDNIELWWFASSKENIGIHSFYRNKIHVLEKFIHYYNIQIENMFDIKNNKNFAKYIGGVKDFKMEINTDQEIKMDLAVKDF